MRRPALLACLLAAGCGAAPVAPTPAAETPIPVATLMSEIVDTLQQNSYKRNAIDWTSFRTQVLAASSAARTMAEARPAVLLALTLIADGHSRYVAADGSSVYYATHNCSAPAAQPVSVAPDIGYVKVTSTSGASVNEFAGALQASIRDQDAGDKTGWIVDLRGNGGGSTYAMLAGVGPLVGEGIAGYFIRPDGVTSAWSYRAGTAYLDDVVGARSTVVYTLRRPNSPVAVLSDAANASAGESTLISFIGLPYARTFGGPSCGLSTGVAGFTMRDGATLNVARSIMADRTGTRYGDVIQPDEAIAGDAPVVARAVAWIRTGR